MSGSSPGPWREFRPTALLDGLGAGAVDFVVIRGIAAVARGSARLTQDLDITYSSDRQNLRLLGKVLAGLDARLRGVDEDVPFVADERTLRHASPLTLSTTAGPLDPLTKPEGAPAYERLRK